MPPLDRELIVKIVSQRKDSFVVLPKLFVDELRPLATSPSLDWQFVPVRMNVTNKAENNKKMTTTSTSSPTTPPTPTTPQTNTAMFVGALVTKNASSERVVEIGPTLAIDLGLGEGDMVAVSAAGTNWKIARKLEITPVNVNESEVVEKNALELQNNLMQSLRVLSLGQKITLRTPAGVCAMVEVLRGSTITSPTNAGCYVLTQGTELHIAVKTRESTKKEVVQPPLPGKLKLLSFSQLSEISNLATTPQDLVSQLVKSQPIAGLMSGADPSILVSPHAASTLNWHDGLLIGYYNIAALLWCNNGSESDSAPTPTTSNNQKQSRTATSATKYGACTPEFLREHSVLGRVRVIQSSRKEDEAVVAVDNANTIAQVDALVGSNIWCIVPSLLSASNPHANATIVAVPNPPVQLYGRKVGCGEGTNRNGSLEARSTLTTVLLSPSPSSGGGTSSGGSILTLPRTMGALPYIAVEDVHGKAVLGELRDALSTCSSLPTTLFNRNVILVGPRGSGKSTLVGRAALSSGRHVVYVDCNAVPTSLSTTVNAAIAQAAACSPSVIVLDGLDAIASTASGSARQGPTQLSTSTTQMVYSWLVETARCYGDISIVATAHSYDELVPICKLPQCFPTVLKMPASLLSEGKFQLVKQLVTAAVTGKAHPNMMTPSEPTVVLHGVVVRHVDGLSHHIATLLTPSLDNYSASDIVAVTNRVLRKCIPTTLSTALAPITLSNADDDNDSHKKVSVIMQEHIPQEAVDDVVAAFVPQSRAGISFLQTGGGEGSRKASWDDAGGLKEAKAALHDVLVLPSKYPHIFKNLPLKSKSGIMLHGPSGCGKTFLLTVVAAAENLHCIVVNGPEIFGKYIGTSEQKIREIFENAQAAAPCVVFFDEFDSVAPRRGNSNTGVTDRVVNQLLCYLDGVESRSDVYVVAATSRPDLIDPALLRPGRLDRHVECPMPSHSDRMEIFAAHLRTASEGKDTLPPEDLDTLASATESWTSADIAGLVSSAHTHMLQRFLNVTVGSLLGEDNDDRAADPTQDDAFMLVDSHVSSNDQNGVVDAALKKSRQKTIESLRRVAEEGGGAGADSKVVASGGDGSSDTNADREVLLPTLQVTDLQEAMLTFNRSRQVEEPRSTAGKRSGQKKNLTQAQLAQIQQMVGTRQTSQ